MDKNLISSIISNNIIGGKNNTIWKLQVKKFLYKTIKKKFIIE